MLLAGCGGSDDAPAAPAAVVIDQPGEAITVEAGDVFAVRVQANPSVGYEWKVLEPTDESVIRGEGFLYVEEGAEPAPGDDVLVDYRFTAVAAGTARIVLQRSYRGEDEGPEQQRAHDVTVNPS